MNIYKRYMEEEIKILTIDVVKKKKKKANMNHHYWS